MSELLVCTHTPVLRSGQAVRTYGIARALAARGPLTLLYARFGEEQPDATFAAIPGIELRETLPSRGLRRLRAYAGALGRGVPSDFARGISAELATDAARAASELRADRVVADGPIAAAALAALARARPVIYNAHNFESGFRHEFESGRSTSVRALRRFERGLLARAAESWMVSEADLRAAHELCPDASLRYVPNVVDVAAIEPVVAQVQEQRAIFVASFSYEPNRRGLEFLLEQVLPRVWEKLPQAKLALVGAGLAQPPSSDPRVETLGFVDDLRTAYARSSCAVVPLLQGGGTPLKFVEALAYGLPVLATPRAAAGLDVRDGVDCLIADGAEAFAAALVRLLGEGDAELGARGRRLAAERYSIETLSRLLA
ncbi:MAG TPA: glycosyltransferase family 4 protein [Solirubrobacteraceae bacterium]|jgi:glycosyltransferase involved in cell wall biosynthesis|nr:glycosyltransferase family 4 protein [Solirubrobacteraceae bacterium]